MKRLSIDGVVYNVVSIEGRVRAQVAPGSIQINVGISMIPTSAHTLPKWWWESDITLPIQTGRHTYFKVT